MKPRLHLVCLALLASATAANAALYSFNCVTGSTANCNTASQYSVNVEDGGTSLGSQTVGFTFRNTAAVKSSILGLYFDQASALLSGHRLPTYTSGVLYVPDLLNARNLPGVSSFSSDFSTRYIGSTNNGLNRSSEYATVRLALSNGTTVSDVVNAINNGSLRLGLQVGSFTTAGTASFLNTSLSQVPEPGAYAALLAIGLLVMFWAKRSRQHQQQNG